MNNANDRLLFKFSTKRKTKMGNVNLLFVRVSKFKSKKLLVGNTLG